MQVRQMRFRRLNNLTSPHLELNPFQTPTVQTLHNRSKATHGSAIQTHGLVFLPVRMHLPARHNMYNRRITPACSTSTARQHMYTMSTAHMRKKLMHRHLSSFGRISMHVPHKCKLSLYSRMPRCTLHMRTNPHIMHLASQYTD